MIPRPVRLGGILVAFALLSGQSCGIGDFGNLVEKPGTITVTNVSADQTAVLAILADDVKSYPTLGPGQTASVQTNVGGRYQVSVVMTPENAAAYRAELMSLRGLVENQLDGTADVAEKTKLFIDLAGIRAAIQALESQNAAGCSGSLKLTMENQERVTASVSWSRSSGTGFWDATCGST